MKRRKVQKLTKKGLSVLTQTDETPPLILAETENLTRDEQLAYRRQGIGGSDAAAVLGISPFRTTRYLYYEKLGFPVDDEGNWVAMEMGHLLEDLVTHIFARKTGLAVYQRKCMFQHLRYPWMLADLDYLVNLTDDTTAILEIKTANYNAKSKQEYDGQEIVPVYYESQGRHYMAVMNREQLHCCLRGRERHIHCHLQSQPERKYPQR